MSSKQKKPEKKGLAIEQIALIVIFFATILITIIYQYSKTNNEVMDYLQQQVDEYENPSSSPSAGPVDE